MRAITIISTPNDAKFLTLANYSKPTLKPDQVLIKVAAAGVNRPDILQRQGLYPPPPGASEILGLEVSGIIVEIGEQITTLNIGDAVCALVNGGGYAEFCVADEGCCLPIPAPLNFIQAAALPETFFTVWHNVYMRGQLKPNESLLVHGGGSGIGTTAIQLAKALANPIFVTASSQEKCQKCLALGADAAINYQETDFVTTIEILTAGKGVNAILDMIGGDYFPRNLKCLANDGRLLQIAIQHGATTEINLWRIMSKQLQITGSTLRQKDTAFKSEIAKQLQQRVWPLIANGQISPVIDSVFPLAEAQKAHQRMGNNQHFGKIILEV